MLLLLVMELNLIFASFFFSFTLFLLILSNSF